MHGGPCGLRVIYLVKTGPPPPKLAKKSKTIKVVALAQSVYILSLLNNKPFNAVSREQISCDFLIIIRLGGFHALSTPLPLLSDEEDPFLFFSPESSLARNVPPPLSFSKFRLRGHGHKLRNTVHSLLKIARFSETLVLGFSNLGHLRARFFFWQYTRSHASQLVSFCTEHLITYERKILSASDWGTPAV